jgi:peptidoglycan DL-endopeptidase CwlO
MGIYVGGDQFVHAPHTGDVVKISSLNEGWYSSTYVGARRIL